MKAATKRIILRWIHLIAVIPLFGYVYQPQAEVAQYVGAARLIFGPILMFTGYWMYTGVAFAIIAVAAWIGLFLKFGFGPALLSQVALLIGNAVVRSVRARRKKQTAQ